MRNYSAASKQIVRLLPGVVVTELEREGQECQCSCPSYGLGICLCAISPLRRLEMTWTDAGPNNVVAFYAIVHFTQEQVGIAFREIFRVLGPGGVFLFTYHVGEETIHITVWSLPMGEDEDSQDEKRAYSQTPPIPHKLPANLLAVLTDQEHRALTAYQQGASQEVAAQRASLSQPTVSRLLTFVWENCQQPPEAISPRTTRTTRHDRRQKLVALFHNRPAGDLVTYEELLALFPDVQSPWYALWTAVSRYRQKVFGILIVGRHSLRRALWQIMSQRKSLGVIFLSGVG